MLSLWEDWPWGAGHRAQNPCPHSSSQGWNCCSCCLSRDEGVSPRISPYVPYSADQRHTQGLLNFFMELFFKFLPTVEVMRALPALQQHSTTPGFPVWNSGFTILPEIQHTQHICMTEKTQGACHTFIIFLGKWYRGQKRLYLLPPQLLLQSNNLFLLDINFRFKRNPPNLKMPHGRG